ncbi:hypothetical protein F4859DRAFT_314541 [Xylaria cf. heliscus]|nr:hypothetical protein F4859DRAFT_314541 [Xylaria cf. heliscus]
MESTEPGRASSLTMDLPGHTRIHVNTFQYKRMIAIRLIRTLIRTLVGTVIASYIATLVRGSAYRQTSNICAEMSYNRELCHPSNYGNYPVQLSYLLFCNSHSPCQTSPARQANPFGIYQPAKQAGKQASKQHNVRSSPLARYVSGSLRRQSSSTQHPQFIPNSAPSPPLPGKLCEPDTATDRGATNCYTKEKPLLINQGHSTVLTYTYDVDCSPLISPHGSRLAIVPHSFHWLRCFFLVCSPILCTASSATIRVWLPKSAMMTIICPAGKSYTKDR